MSDGKRPVALPYSTFVACMRCGVTLQMHVDVYGRWLNCTPAPQEGAVPSSGETEVDVEAITREFREAMQWPTYDGAIAASVLGDILRKHLSHPTASTGESER